MNHFDIFIMYNRNMFFIAIIYSILQVIDIDKDFKL